MLPLRELSRRGLQEGRGAGRYRAGKSAEASGVGSTDPPCKFSRVPNLPDGWGQSSIQSWFFSVHVSLAEFPGNLLHIYLCWVICFQICTEGESAIWLQKVIWLFIFRAALPPTACFKLNLWHKNIHHFNCRLLFSQAQSCFIFFFLSPVVLVLCFFWLCGLIHHFLKSKILIQTKHFL